MEEEQSRGRLAMLILSILSSAPAHGYRIARSLEEKSRGEFRLREGVLYPLLHSLEARGLIQAAWELGERGKERKVYRLTPAGGDHLGKMLAIWHKEQAAIELVIREVLPCVG